VRGRTATARPAGSLEMTVADYDELGHDYARGRRTDPRWMVAIHEALGSADTVVNVGAGTGSYEPANRHVVAVEPSAVMLTQRPTGAAPAVRAVAEALPFAAGTFDAALAVLTLHHWSDPAAGLRELRRVAHRQVLLAFDPEGHARFWLVRDYLPHLVDHLRRTTPPLNLIDEILGPTVKRPLLVPADHRDGVLAAHWARPAAYLDADVRAHMSGIATSEQSLVRQGIARLEADLNDGTWHDRYGHLARMDAYDAGYQLIVAGA
jgi:SAM-dependent methyltransferase